MKDAKIVKRDEAGFKAFLTQKKGWAVIVGILIIFMLFLTAMPMVKIPVLGNIGRLFGLSAAEMKDITFADAAAYLAGIDGNKIASVQNFKYSSQYDTIGGLSPIALVADNRIAQASADSLRQYQESIGYVPGSVGLTTAKMPGEEGYGGVPMNGEAGVAPILAERQDGSKNKLLGNPIYGMFSQEADPSGQKRFIAQKPIGGQDIDSQAMTASRLSGVVEKVTNKFVGGRTGAMGGYNAFLNRVNTKITSMGQMNAFGAASRVYFFSYNGKMAGYKTTAKTLAEAAFDGGETTGESLIEPGEKQDLVLNSLEPASTVVSKAKARSAKCDAAKQVYQQAIVSVRQSFKASMDSLKAIGDGYSNGIPGCCEKTLGFFGAQTDAKRNAWNSMVDNLATQCNDLKSKEGAYADSCGFTYDATPKGDCADFKNMHVNGGCTPFFVWQCKNKVKFTSSSFKCSGTSACHSKMDTLLDDVLQFNITGTNGSF